MDAKLKVGMEDIQATDDVDAPLLPAAPDAALNSTVHPRLVVPIVAALACLVSVQHSATYSTWARLDGPWYGPSNGVKALAGLSVLHLCGVHVAKRLCLKGHPWQCTLAIVLHSAILYAGTVVNGLLTHRPTALEHVTACTFTITFFLWTLACAFVCVFTAAHKEAFWVAYAAGFLFMEHLRWTTEWFGDEVVIDGTKGIVLVLAAVVSAIACAFKMSPTPNRDACYSLGVLLFLGVRIAVGYHVHHAEWPMYAAFPLRHHRGGWAMGVLVGVMAQEIAGGAGYRLFCDGAFAAPNVNWFVNH